MQMVLDAGHIVGDTALTIRGSLLINKQVEFGKPADLLANEKGMLRALLDESGDKEELYAMVEKHR